MRKTKKRKRGNRPKKKAGCKEKFATNTLEKKTKREQREM